MSMPSIESKKRFITRGYQSDRVWESALHPGLYWRYCDAKLYAGVAHGYGDPNSIDTSTVKKDPKPQRTAIIVISIVCVAISFVAVFYIWRRCRGTRDNEEKEGELRKEDTGTIADNTFSIVGRFIEKSNQRVEKATSLKKPVETSPIAKSKRRKKQTLGGAKENPKTPIVLFSAKTSPKQKPVARDKKPNTKPNERSPNKAQNKPSPKKIPQSKTSPKKPSQKKWAPKKWSPKKPLPDKGSPKKKFKGKKSESSGEKDVKIDIIPDVLCSVIGLYMKERKGGIINVPKAQELLNWAKANGHSLTFKGAREEIRNYTSSI